MAEADQEEGDPRGRNRDAGDPALQVMRALEEDIVLGMLHPRERLVEDELMARFGVKRHVVRKALAELENQGLVQHKKNSGAQVRALGAKEVTDLYALRELLEGQCAKLIPLPLRPGQLEQIEALHREHLAAVKRKDAREVFRSNLSFHAALFALCGNDALIEAITEYARRSFPVRLSALMSPQPRNRAIDEHEQIIAALRDGERKKLVALFTGHLRPSRDSYIAALESLERLEQTAA
jgi:DNA-binding GntR family transcriptional regulator